MTPLGPETTEFFKRTAAITNSTSCDLNSTSCDLNSTSCNLNKSANHVFAAFYSLVFVAGLLLNGFTLKVYFCGPVKTCSLSIYLKNLAAADFLLCLCLPLRVARFASSSLLVQHSYCHFGAAAFYLNMYASILFMGYIARNRYLKIVHPLGNGVCQTVQATRLISMVTWAFLLAVMTAYVVLSLLTQQAVAEREAILRCEDLHSRQLKMFYRVAHGGLATVFLLALGSLLFFYCCTTRRLAEAQRRQPASARSGRLARSRRNMLVLVGVFCVCFVPYHLVRLPYAFWWGRSQPPCHAFYLKELATMLSVLNVCLDPLIYFLFCKAFSMQLGWRGARRGAGLARHLGASRAMHLGALQVELSSTQANTQERRSNDFRVVLEASGNINLL